MFCDDPKYILCNILTRSVFLSDQLFIEGNFFIYVRTNYISKGLKRMHVLQIRDCKKNIVWKVTFFEHLKQFWTLDVGGLGGKC